MAEDRGGRESVKERRADGRRERLAAALRDNFGRRKAQARAREDKQMESRSQDDTTGRERDGNG